MWKAFVIIIALFAALPVAGARAQLAQESHIVTVEVDPTVLITVSRPSVELVAGEAGLSAGRQVLTAVDESTVLSWRINRRNFKITVQTDLAAPKYTLSALAVNATAGSPAPEQILSTTPRDFIRNVGQTSGTASIRYTGTATLEQGSGTDTHLVTFTITQQ